MVYQIILFKNILQICYKNKHLWKRSVNFFFQIFFQLLGIHNNMIRDSREQPGPVNSVSWQPNVADVVKVLIYTIVHKNNVKS